MGSNDYLIYPCVSDHLCDSIGFLQPPVIRLLFICQFKPQTRLTVVDVIDIFFSAYVLYDFRC